MGDLQLRIHRACRQAVYGVLALTATAIGLPMNEAGAQSSTPGSDECVVPTAATANDLSSRWVTALKTRHPDRVTRLFASDGALLGFASPVGRASYASIREYYLYFLQFEPQLKFGQHELEGGCNFFIDTGTYTWTLKTKSGDVQTRDARYRFIYEFSAGQWRIAQHVDALQPGTGDQAFAVPAPAPARVARRSENGTAVAGYLKRRSPPDNSDVGADSAPSAKSGRHSSGPYPDMNLYEATQSPR